MTKEHNKISKALPEIDINSLMNNCSKIPLKLFLNLSSLAVIFPFAGEFAVLEPGEYLLHSLCRVSKHRLQGYTRS